MSYTFFSGVTLFQGAVAAHWSRLTTATAEVMDRIQELPVWRQPDLQRPSSLADLVRPAVVLRFILDPQTAVSVCRALHLDPRDVFKAEILPGRLLPYLPVLDLTMTDCLHSVPASKLIQLLEKHPNARLFVKRAGQPEVLIRKNSIISIIFLQIREDERLTFRAEGEGARPVIDGIRRLNQSGWGKNERTDRSFKVWKVNGRTVEEVKREIESVMEDFGGREISGVFHVPTRRLYLGWLVNGHLQIAEAAGLKDKGSYTRINFDGKHRGRLFAYFPGELPGENLLGQMVLRKWLAELFQGRPAPFSS